jgi:hypothetical protein
MRGMLLAAAGAVHVDGAQDPHSGARPGEADGAAPAAAPESAAAGRVAGQDEEGAGWTIGARRLDMLPSGELHAPYVADPHKPENAALAQHYTSSRIFDTSSERFALSAGGRFGLLRLEPGHPEGRAWQLSIDAGLDFQVDSQHKQDAIGWDGSYGLTLTTARGPWSFKAAHIHTSGHVGDEYAERTGRKRIDYTRADLGFAAARRIGRGARAYAEVGWAYHLLTEEQRPWRLQAGLEYESRRVLFGGRCAWYAAADLQWLEERDYRTDSALQVGLSTRAGGKRFRLGLAYDDGRALMTEFFQDTEAWFSLGIWIDL